MAAEKNTAQKRFRLRITLFLIVNVIVGEPDDPHLGSAVVDSVLIANTYHELKDPNSILAHILHSLRPGGRLVVVDRGPGAAEMEDVRSLSGSHELPAVRVESELIRDGFIVVSSDRNFIDARGDHWWLILAQKPQ